MAAIEAGERAQRALRALRDGSSLRLVGQARLRLDHRDHAWSAQQALEDGLNTADFADCGRLIVVRSLHLGRLAAEGGGVAMARALEAAWRALAPSMLHGSHPAAEQAPAVWFRSVAEARVEWLQRVAADRPAGAWYWPRALPEWAAPGEAPGSDRVIVRVIGAMLADEPQALAACLAEWPVTSVRRVVLALPLPLPAALKRWGGRALPVPRLAEPGEGAMALRPTTGGAALAGSGAREAVRERVARRLESLGLPDDERRAWVAAVALMRGVPGGADEDDLLTVMARLETGGGEASVLHGVPVRAAAPGPSARSANEEGSPPLRAGEAPHLAIRDALLRPMSSPDPSPSSAEGRAARPARASSRPWLDDGLPTAHGGLLMLLNALRALRFEAWLERQPPGCREALVSLMLRTLAERVRLPAQDPQWPLFTRSEVETRGLADAVCTWQGFRWPAPIDAPLATDSSGAVAAIDTWRQVLRRALRQHGRIGLASLVLREARVSITATHADVVLPLKAVDLRLRRAGLDRDPGWLPWFGWIVKFHYVDIEPGAGGRDA